jgi:hypothetical protein
VREEHAIRVPRSSRRREKNEKDTLAKYPILVLCLMLVAVDSLISQSVSLQLVFVEIFFLFFELEAENKNVLFVDAEAESCNGRCCGAFNLLPEKFAAAGFSNSF